MTKKLRLISSSTVADPTATPAGLGPEGSALWRRVHQEYDVSDVAGWTMLREACRALDRAARCREQINKQGEVVALKGHPPKEHPLLKAELAAQSFLVRTLARLGLDSEPIKQIGRPGPGFRPFPYDDDGAA
jgi:phage terminase small subunit